MDETYTLVDPCPFCWGKVRITDYSESLYKITAKAECTRCGMEAPTAAEDGAKKPHPERPCRVIYVNPRHLWYMVQFANGLRECYKVPAGGAMG